MALASELLDVDDLGNTKELNDGAVPKEQGVRAAA